MVKIILCFLKTVIFNSIFFLMNKININICLTRTDLFALCFVIFLLFCYPVIIRKLYTFFFIILMEFVIYFSIPKMFINKKTLFFLRESKNYFYLFSVWKIDRFFQKIRQTNKKSIKIKLKLMPIFLYFVSIHNTGDDE